MIRLLVVEPNKLLQLGLLSCLEDTEGFEVVGIAESGDGAILAAGKNPDAVLINVELPDMAGSEVIRQLKARHPGIKIIALFVSDDENEILDALQAGADAYCLKHSAPERLIEAICTVDEGGAWLDPPIARKVITLMADGNFKIASKKIPGPEMVVTDKSYQMTDRELKILSMIVGGNSNEEIAKALSISYHTVKSDVTQIFLKLGVQDRVQAAVKALTEGLTEPVGKQPEPK